MRGARQGVEDLVLPAREARQVSAIRRILSGRESSLVTEAAMRNGKWVEKEDSTKLCGLP